ncbi:hypothetical protein HZA57_09315 [Candidatus Poribacteria bacterium]|nr:hypothetical protein [Candidatus Poribacteria bacterium]
MPPKPKKLRFALPSLCLAGALCGRLLFAQGAGADVAELPAPARAGTVLQATPTPTPTPVLSPSPSAAPTAPPIKFSPPFSLSDCLRLVSLATDAIPTDKAGQESVHRDSLGQLITSVTDYLKDRDDLHSNLIGYQWTRIGRGKVREPLIQGKTFDWSPEEYPAEVSALSFEVTGGDAQLHAIRVFDPSSEEPIASFLSESEKPVLLRHSLPRREVFHLWRPATISKIEVAYSQVVPSAEVVPRVYVYAGRTDKPEYGKAAIFYLTRAQQRVELGRVAEGREDLVLARQEIIKYRRQLRLNE